MKILLCCRYKNQHVVVKIQLFLVCMRLYSQSFMFPWSSMHIYLKTPQTNKKIPNPNAKLHNKPTKPPLPLQFTVNVICTVTALITKSKKKSKWEERVIVNGAADYHSWVVRLAELCPLLHFSKNGKTSYTLVNIIKNPLNSLKVLQSLSW